MWGCGSHQAIRRWWWAANESSRHVLGRNVSFENVAKDVSWKNHMQASRKRDPHWISLLLISQAPLWFIWWLGVPARPLHQGPLSGFCEHWLLEPHSSSPSPRNYPQLTGVHSLCSLHQPPQEEGPAWRYTGEQSLAPWLFHVSRPLFILPFS